MSIKHFDLLGMKVTDRVTGLSGVVTSISFDLFGCVCATVDPGLDKDGKPRDRGWYDVARLQVDSKKPVMEQPNFETNTSQAAIAAGKHGPADKPAYCK